VNTSKRTTIVFVLLISLAVSACGLPQLLAQNLAPTVDLLAPPGAASTDTPIPPTATTAAIAGSKEPIVIGNYKLSISTVELNSHGFNGLTPAGLTSDQTVLVVQVTLNSGDLAALSKVRLSVTDERGNRTDSATTLSVAARKQVIWLFAVAKTAHSFLLYFPTGEVIDLSPLLPGAPATPSGGNASPVTPAATSGSAAGGNSWKGIPIMSGATGGVEASGGYAYYTTASANEITKYYKQELAKLGWTLASSATDLHFTRGSSFLVITISAYGGQSLVGIGLAE
jgi:hypothetical protein